LFGFSVLKKCHENEDLSKTTGKKKKKKQESKKQHFRGVHNQEFYHTVALTPNEPLRKTF
jgi:hypothetical protein